MANLERVVDNRWRPDLESSQQRVRDEEREEGLPVIQSRELSFVPARRKQFEPHDAQRERRRAAPQRDRHAGRR
jgi:hypothetical protein